MLYFVKDGYNERWADLLVELYAVISCQVDIFYVIVAVWPQ